MNREQVVKALECCRAVPFRRCYECHYREFEPNPAQCTMILSKQAYALIRELTEENEMLKADTVKTAERIKQAICDNTYPDFNKDGKPVNVWSAVNGYDAIDKIVEDMLNERIDS